MIGAVERLHLTKAGEHDCGASLIELLGNGWVIASSPSQPLQSSELYNASKNEYAEASGIR